MAGYASFLMTLAQLAGLVARFGEMLQRLGERAGPLADADLTRGDLLAAVETLGQRGAERHPRLDFASHGVEHVMMLGERIFLN